MLGGGAGATVLALVGSSAGTPAGGGLGPAQFQVLCLGVLLAVGGLLPWPARRVSQVLEWAGRRHPRLAAPVTRYRGPLLAIVVVAVAFRLLIVTAYWPSNQLVMGMSLWDAEMARNLIEGRGWVLNWDFLNGVDRVQTARESTVDLEDFLPADDSAPGALEPFQQYAHTPGYSLWLALSFLVGGGHRFAYSQYMQCVLDGLACFLAYGVGRRLWSPAAGLVGAAFYAVSPAHAYLASQTVAAATDSFWVVALTYGLVRLWTDLAADRPGWPGALVVALAALGGTIMNSAAFVLPMAGAGMAVLLAFRFPSGWRAAGHLVGAQVLVVLLLVPWGLRNEAVYGRFTLLRQTTWQLVWETLGQLPNPWGLGIGPNDVVYFDWVRANCPTPCTAVAREAMTRDYLVSTVFPSPELPAHLLRLVWERLPGLVYVARLPVDGRYPADSFTWRGLAAGLGTLNFAALLLFPGALLGLLILLQRSETAAPALLGLAPTLFILLFSLLFFVEHRKTTPAYGYLLMLSAVAVTAVVTHDPQDR